MCFFNKGVWQSIVFCGAALFEPPSNKRRHKYDFRFGVKNLEFRIEHTAALPKPAKPLQTSKRQTTWNPTTKP